MPTYEYKCRKCGNLFDQFQKMTAKAAAKCPKCGAKAERQLSGGAGLVFKGSGFYLTDYGRAGQSKPSAEGDKAEKPATEKKTSSESKPESKPKKKKDE